MADLQLLSCLEQREEPNMTLAERIFALRTQMGLSQEELAEQLGVSRQSVSKWETGQSVPDLDKLIKLADLFGVTLDELARDTSEQGEDTSAREPERTPFWRRDLLSPWLEDLQHRIFVFIVLILATVLAVALKVPGALWLPVLAFEVVLVTKRQPLVVGGTLLIALLLHVPPLLVGVLVGLFLVGALYLVLPDIGKKK